MAMQGAVIEQFPWDRRLDETEEAWAAFQAFLLSGTPRKHYPVIAKDLGKALGQIKLWGTKHQWRKRATLYDSFYTNKTSTVVSQELAAYRAQINQDELESYASMLEKWQAAFDATSDINDLTKLVRIREAIDQLGRRAVQMPSTYSAKEKAEEVADEVNEYMVDFTGMRRLSATTEPQ